MSELRVTTVPRDLYYHEVAYVRRLEGALRSIAQADEREPRQPDDSDWRSRFLEAKRVANLAINPKFSGGTCSGGEI